MHVPRSSRLVEPLDLQCKSKHKGHLTDNRFSFTGLFFPNLGEVVPYFASLGYPCPPHTNPADHVISIINTDFSSSTYSTKRVDDAQLSSEGFPADRVERLAEAWKTHTSSGASRPSTPPRRSTQRDGMDGRKADASTIWAAKDRHRFSDEAHRAWLLIKRASLNYRRNLLAYGIRVAMYG